MYFIIKNTKLLLVLIWVRINQRTFLLISIKSDLFLNLYRRNLINIKLDSGLTPQLFFQAYQTRVSQCSKKKGQRKRSDLHYPFSDPIFWSCLHIFVNRCVTKFAFSIQRRPRRARFQSKQARIRFTSSPEPFRIRIVFFAVLNAEVQQVWSLKNK